MILTPLTVTFAVVLLSVHIRLAEWKLDEGLRLFRNYFRRSSPSQPDPHQQRVEAAMSLMMMEHYKRVVRYLSHFLLAVMLWFVYRWQRSPNLGETVQLLVVILNYVLAWFVVRTRLDLRMLRWLTLISHIMHCFFVTNTHFSEVGEHHILATFSAAMRVCVAAIIHDPPVIIPCQAVVCLAEVLAYFGLEANYAGPRWHFLVSEGMVLALVCGVAVMVHEFAQSCVRASFQSADDTLFVKGFQRVLRGICDADVLLDQDLRIEGDPSRLRRVLDSPGVVCGQKFTDLLESEEKKKFETFIRKSAYTSKLLEDADGSIPPCVRVSLAIGNAQVGVDIFHVPMPRMLDAGGPHHLLAINEDPETRHQPDAKQGAIPEMLWRKDGADENSDGRSGSGSQKPISEAAFSKGSVPSSALPLVQPLPELRELTMLVDAGTDSQDVVQLHAKFRRNKAVSDDIHSCMPSLQSLLRPSDWINIRNRVAAFGHEQHLPGTPEEAEELPPVMLRRLDDPCKCIAANGVSLAKFRPPGGKPSESSKKRPALLWLYVRDFLNDNAHLRPQPQRSCDISVASVD